MEDVLYTVEEVSKLIKSNVDYVHRLRKAKLLPFLKLGSYKCRRTALLEFLEKYQGYDLTDPYNIKELEENKKWSCWFCEFWTKMYKTYKR